jgi:succinate-semialdehyde dehydrogenase/glutarate-semialdehyde dehydrogenase
VQTVTPPDADVARPAYPELALFIDGEWITERSRSGAVIEPATGREIARVPFATLDDVDRAAAAAARAFPLWRATTALARGRILARIGELIRKDSDRLAKILTLEQGKTRTEAAGELIGTADTFEWMAEEGKRIYGRVVPSRFPGTTATVMHEPVGVVAAFSPWNFPAVLAARKIATALAAGCTVVLKPAEETPGILVAIAHLCQEAGLPDGVLNVLYGVPAEISSRLIASPHVAKISFTGSVPVGRHLAALAGSEMKRVTLELGGHSPVLICDDADVERVAQMAVLAKFRNAGQICHAPTRFFVQSGVYDAFVESLARHASALRVGNGLTPGMQMGPLANARRTVAMEGLTRDAEAQGARVVCGGAPPESGGDGFFWSPTILADVPPSARIMREEPFGPLAPVARFDHLDDALDRANSVDYGLASYAFTNSAKAVRRISERIEAGSLSINTFAMSPPEMPFGGVKQSGMGSEMGTEGISEHLRAKAILHADLD